MRRNIPPRTILIGESAGAGRTRRDWRSVGRYRGIGAPLWFRVLVFVGVTERKREATRGEGVMRRWLMAGGLWPMASGSLLVANCQLPVAHC